MAFASSARAGERTAPEERWATAAGAIRGAARPSRASSIRPNVRARTKLRPARRGRRTPSARRGSDPTGRRRRRRRPRSVPRAGSPRRAGRTDSPRVPALMVGQRDDRGETEERRRRPAEDLVAGERVAFDRRSLDRVEGSRLPQDPGLIVSLPTSCSSAAASKVRASEGGIPIRAASSPATATMRRRCSAVRGSRVAVALTRRSRRMRSEAVPRGSLSARLRLG